MSDITILQGKRIMPSSLHRFCVEAMRRHGIRPEDAELAAEVFTTTDTWGIHTHGTRQIRPLLRNFRRGRLDAEAISEVIAEGSGWALMNGHHSMPPATACRAMQLAITKARTTGIAYVGVQHSSHFGAAGYYAVMAAREDMIGISMTNVEPVMTVPGSRAPVLGTNPIAYAVPAGQERPIFLDIATSAVAATKVLAAKQLGKTIPDTWLVDERGLPTTDPRGFPEKGAMQPMAGHKGYGLALLVEILCGALTGTSMLSQMKSWVLDIPERNDQGHAFIAIHVNAIMPIEQFKQRIDWIIREIRAAPLAEGASRIYLPGEMEWERRDRALAEGMILPDDVLENLVGLAEDYRMDVGALIES